MSASQNRDKQNPQWDTNHCLLANKLVYCITITPPFNLGLSMPFEIGVFSLCNSVLFWPVLQGMKDNSTWCAPLLCQQHLTEVNKNVKQ